MLLAAVVAVAVGQLHRQLLLSQQAACMAVASHLPMATQNITARPKHQRHRLQQQPRLRTQRLHLPSLGGSPAHHWLPHVHVQPMHRPLPALKPTLQLGSVLPQLLPRMVLAAVWQAHVSGVGPVSRTRGRVVHQLIVWHLHSLWSTSLRRSSRPPRSANPSRSRPSGHALGRRSVDSGGMLRRPSLSRQSPTSPAAHPRHGLQL